MTYTKTPPFTVTLGIHPAARWSDGVPVTARDFVFTHDAIVEHLPPELQGPHQLARSVRAVGTKTVRVVLRSRTADWRSLFYRVMPRHALRGQDLAKVWRDEVDDPRTGAPIGNGPFLLQSWERGRQITLVRNPRYWGPHTAYLDRIVIRFCRPCPLLPAPAEVLADLRQGEVDMVSTRDPAVIPELRSTPGLKVVSSRLLGAQPAHAPPRPRRASRAQEQARPPRAGLQHRPGRDRAHGLRRDRPALPRGESAVLWNSHRSYRPNWDIYRYRPALARRLLEQAGCQRGADGIYVCAGQRLSLRLSARAGLPFRTRTVELIGRHLRQVGIEVVISFSAFATFGEILESGAFDLAEFTWFNFDRIGGEVYGCGGAFNYTGHCQRLVTADLNQADRILDAEQRARVLNRADRRLAKDVPVIPLYQPPGLIAFRATIRNVVAGSGNELTNAENWWLDR